MKRTMVSGVIMALLSAGAYAQTSVSFYGVVDVAAGRIQYSGQRSNLKVDSGAMQTSHFGFAGRENLGGGLSATFDLSAFYRADSGLIGRFSGIPGVPDDPFLSRRATVGLESPFGELRMGRGSSPYFVSLIQFNSLADSPAFSPIFLHTYPGGQSPQLAAPINGPDSGVSNMIQYFTPNFGGLRATVQYGFGEVAGDSSTNRISASATYMSGPMGFSLAVARDKLPLAFVTEEKQTSYLVGGFYDFGVARLFAQYAQTTQKFTTTADREFKTTQLGAAIPISVASKLLVSWGRTKIDLPAGVSAYSPTPAAPIPAGTRTLGVDPKRNTLSTVYDYNLSKRTDIYAALLFDKYTGLESGKTAAVGIRHKF